MRNMHITTKGGELTLGGLLYFGKAPQDFRPNFCIKAVSFFGNELGGTEYRDSRDIIYTMFVIKCANLAIIFTMLAIKVKE